MFDDAGVPEGAFEALAEAEGAVEALVEGVELDMSPIGKSGAETEGRCGREMEGRGSLNANGATRARHRWYKRLCSDSYYSLALLADTACADSRYRPSTPTSTSPPPPCSLR